MNMKRMKKSLSLILCMVLIAAMVLFAAGCDNSSAVASSPTDLPVSFPADGSALGEGSRQFTFAVTDADGSEVRYEIHTDAETVGEALMELQLISGEPGSYGLYVKSVIGITADYDKDGTYWAFYVNGDYAMSGVDTTDIEDGAVYAMKVEK